MSVDRAAAAITRGRPSTPPLTPGLRLATVNTTSPLTVTMGGDTTSVPAVALHGYLPVAGDIVAVLHVSGAAPLIVGSTVRSTAPVTADVVTSQTTTSTSYTDLTTVGPAVTVPVLAGQPVQVTISARCVHSAGATQSSVASFAVSGSETVAAADADSIEAVGTSAYTLTRQRIWVPTVTGSATLTMKYRVTNGGTATFFNRRIIAQPQ